MITVKCTYSNGDTITTPINGTIETAENYFLGNWFNFGDNDFNERDNMQQCIKVDLVYNIEFVESTACFMLKSGNEYIDSTFINKFRYENDMMDKAEIQMAIEELTARNNVKEYVIY